MASLSDQIRRQWIIFEEWLAGPRAATQKRRDEVSKEADRTWLATPAKFRPTKEQHEANKRGMLCELEEELVSLAQVEWQRRLWETGLNAEDWVDMTFAERVAIERALGGVMDAEDNFSYEIPTLDHSGEGTSPDSHMADIPPSFAFVNPTSLGLDDGYDGYDGYDAGLSLSTDRCLHHEISGDDEADIGTFAYRAWGIGSASTKPLEQSRHVFAESFAANNIFSGSSPTALFEPPAPNRLGETLRAPAVPAMHPTDTTPSVKSGTTRVRRPGYTGPQLNDASDTSSEEEDFEQFKMEVRISKIVEFHHDAALADIGLAQDIFLSRKNGPLPAEDEAKKIAAHEQTMVELRRSKEDERKTMVEAERQKRRAEIRRRASLHPSAASLNPSQVFQRLLEGTPIQINSDVEKHFREGQLLAQNRESKVEGAEPSPKKKPESKDTNPVQAIYMDFKIERRFREEQRLAESREPKPQVTVSSSRNIPLLKSEIDSELEIGSREGQRLAQSLDSAPQITDSSSKKVSEPNPKSKQTSPNHIVFNQQTAQIDSELEKRFREEQRLAQSHDSIHQATERLSKKRTELQPKPKQAPPLHSLFDPSTVQLDSEIEKRFQEEQRLAQSRDLAQSAQTSARKGVEVKPKTKRSPLLQSALEPQAVQIDSELEKRFLEGQRIAGKRESKQVAESKSDNDALARVPERNSVSGAQQRWRQERTAETTTSTAEPNDLSGSTPNLRHSRNKSQKIRMVETQTQASIQNKTLNPPAVNAVYRKKPVTAPGLERSDARDTKISPPVISSMKQGQISTSETQHRASTSKIVTNPPVESSRFIQNYKSEAREFWVPGGMTEARLSPLPSLTRKVLDPSLSSWHKSDQATLSSLREGDDRRCPEDIETKEKLRRMSDPPPSLAFMEHREPENDTANPKRQSILKDSIKQPKITKRVTLEEVSDEEADPWIAGSRASRNVIREHPTNANIILEPKPSVSTTMFSQIFQFDESGENDSLTPPIITPSISTASTASRQSEVQSSFTDDWYIGESIDDSRDGPFDWEVLSTPNDPKKTKAKHVRWTPSVLGNRTATPITVVKDQVSSGSESNRGIISPGRQVPRSRSNSQVQGYEEKLFPDKTKKGPDRKGKGKGNTMQDLMDDWNPVKEGIESLRQMRSNPASAV